MNLLNVLILSRTAAAKMNKDQHSDIFILQCDPRSGPGSAFSAPERQSRWGEERKEKNVNHTHGRVLCLQYLVCFSSAALPSAWSVFSGGRQPFSTLGNKARS